jgi:hypothetical protein
MGLAWDGFRKASPRKTLISAADWIMFRVVLADPSLIVEALKMRIIFEEDIEWRDLKNLRTPCQSGDVNGLETVKLDGASSVLGFGWRQNWISSRIFELKLALCYRKKASRTF